MDPVLEDLLGQWLAATASITALKHQLDPIVASEHRLRKDIASYAFSKESKEGTHYYDLPNDWRLKCAKALDRKVDKAVLSSVLNEYRSRFGVAPDECFEYKPQLVVSKYRKLTDEQRTLLDLALTITEKMPEVEVLPPKEK